MLSPDTLIVAHIPYGEKHLRLRICVFMVCGLYDSCFFRFIFSFSWSLDGLYGCVGVRGVVYKKVGQ